MIRISNLKKAYKSNDVLKGVNLNIKPKEIKAIIGLNGSGKSTLVEILCGIRRYDEGEILIDDIDLSNNYNKEKINRILGYMPQSFCIKVNGKDMGTKL